MISENIGEFMTFLGVVVSAAFLFLGGRRAARDSLAATNQAAEVAKANADAAALVQARRERIESFDALVARLEADVGRRQEREEHLEARLDELEARQEAQRSVLMIHAAWDHLAAQALRSLGQSVPDPPPLTPPA